MSKAGFFQALKLSRFSTPVHERSLYRTVKTENIRRIVEIGIGTGQRAQNLLSLALRIAPADDIRYAGIDMFEAGEGSGIPLKEFHAQLKSTGVNVRLVPGDCLLYTSPSPRDATLSRMPSSA